MAAAAFASGPQDFPEVVVACITLLQSLLPGTPPAYIGSMQIGQRNGAFADQLIKPLFTCSSSPLDAQSKDDSEENEKGGKQNKHKLYIYIYVSEFPSP